MIRMLRYLKPLHWVMAIFSVSFIVGQAYFDLQLPDLMGNILTEAQRAAAGTGSLSNILDTGFKMLLYALGSIGCTIIAGFLAALVGAGLAHSVRERIFDRVENFSLAEIKLFSTSSLITRTTNDITQITTTLIMAMRMAVMAPVTAIAAFCIILNKSYRLSAVTGAGLLALIVMIAVMFFFVLPKFKAMQKKIDKLNSVTRENLTGLRVVRAYNAEKYQENKFDAANADIAGTELFVLRASGFVMPGMGFIMSMVALSIVWLGAYLVRDNAIPPADLAVFIQYSTIVLINFMMLSMMFVMLPRASVSAKRVNQVLDTPISITDGTVTDGAEGVTGEVVFDKVSFKYPGADKYVLNNISFTAKKGETVAFIGSTGSGKSTLINLIPRFYDVTEGEVLIDGVNVREYRLDSLNAKMGYVPQKGFLFDGSIAENVRVGKDDATDEEIWDAVKIAQAENFVRELDGGLSYHIAQGGKNVSGGQRQRLSIARAVVRNPEIYIFDDSFSALDYKTDKALRAELKKHTKNATTLIVASRVGTIMDADKIVVLDKGDLVGMGKHGELLKSCDVYREIAYSQLSKEELGA